MENNTAQAGLVVMKPAKNKGGQRAHANGRRPDARLVRVKRRVDICWPYYVRGSPERGDSAPCLWKFFRFSRNRQPCAFL